MSKLLIDKEKLEARIAELEKNSNSLSLLASAYPEIIIELQSILQQGEEYNENEAIEFAEWIQKSYQDLIYSLQHNQWVGNDDGRPECKMLWTTQELFKMYKNERIPTTRR